MMGRRAKGFSLVEVVLASALMGMLLLALNFFVLSMAEIWGGGTERRLFAQHVRAVVREVESWLETAIRPSRLETPGIFAAEIRLDDGRTEVPLTFVLPEGSERLTAAGPRLPEVVGALVVQPGRGLVLYWQSRLETDFDAAAPRPWLVTPLVKALHYEYRESTGWRRSDRLLRDDDGQWRLPDRLLLQFEHRDLRTEAGILLPTTTGRLPHF